MKINLDPAKVDTEEIDEDTKTFLRHYYKLSREVMRLNEENYFLKNEINKLNAIIQEHIRW